MNKETAKNGFPSRGKTKNQRKSTFPHEGKEENSGRYFPKIGKTRKCGKSDFPNLGRTKNGRKWLSQHWEDRKTAKKCFPKLGKNKKSQRLHFPILGRTKNIVGSFSNPLDERFFLFFIHPRSRMDCFFHFPFIRALGRAVFLIFCLSEASDEHFNAWLSTNPFAVWCSKQSSFLSDH